MDIISVHIPQNEFYTLYAEGNTQKISQDAEYFSVDFPDDSVIFLYYTFQFHRRVYITCSPNKNAGNIHYFGDADVPLSVLGQLRGRTFDQFKQAANFLNIYTKGRFYNYPLQFFYQLLCLLRSKKNSNDNMQLLASLYDSTLDPSERIEWKH